MDYEELVGHLEDLAERLDIEVRWDLRESEGGIFTLRGQKILAINDELPDEMKTELMAAALADQDIENVYVLPEVRRFIESCKETK